MKAQPGPMVSGRYFFPNAPLLWRKWIPPCAVMSRKVICWPCEGSAVQNNSAAARTTAAKAGLLATRWPALVTRWPERLKPRPDTMQNGLAQLKPRPGKTQNKELSASIYLDAPGDEVAIAAVEVRVFRRVMIFLPGPGNGAETG